MIMKAGPDCTANAHPTTAMLLGTAKTMRREIVNVLFEVGGGHYGGALSVLDILLTLYLTTLRVDPVHPDAPWRDRVILSKGHAAIALYAVLRHMGFFDESLLGYAQSGSRLAGHPDMHLLPGVDFTTGSLGQGLSVGLGMAQALAGAADVWVVLGDGECQEGQVWEAARLAALLRPRGLRVVVDANGYQECATGSGRHRPPMDALDQKWRAFGWRVHEVDGHDYSALRAVYAEVAKARELMVAIIARTRKGCGYAFAEENPHRFHCAALSRAEHGELLRSER
jgi:transketolase